jgi:hypothetical protein
MDFVPSSTNPLSKMLLTSPLPQTTKTTYYTYPILPSMTSPITKIYPTNCLVLGLGFEFIPTPKYTTSNVTSTPSRLRRDMHLKTYFLGVPVNDFTQRPSKLYVKSPWNPPRSDIPPQIDDELDTFSEKLTNLFKHKHSPPNLLPFQEQILQSIIARTSYSLTPIKVWDPVQLPTTNMSLTALSTSKTPPHTND